MLNKLHIQNFKSLRDVTLNLGRLNVFVGANASGKSNILDALRVLQGIGNRYSISEILDGKPNGATNDRWSGIRGGSTNVSFDKLRNTPVRFDVSSTFTRRIYRLKDPNHSFVEKEENASYSIAFLPDVCRLTTENVSLTSNVIYDSTGLNNNPHQDANFRVRYFHGKPGRQPQIVNDAATPILSQFVTPTQGWQQRPLKLQTVVRCRAFLRQLANIQYVSPSPTVLGEYTKLQQIERMGEQGENFSGLVKNICADPESKAAYLQWLQHLRPDEIEDVGTFDGAMSDPMFYIQERGKKFPAPVLSEGTLLFAALAAAFFQPDMPAAITIEEPENGIHPSRLRLLMELLRKQSARTGTQVFITTHSPVLLDWLQPEDYAHTFFCKRENSGESQVRSLANIPLFNDVVKQAPLGELFTEGWLEEAL